MDNLLDKSKSNGNRSGVLSAFVNILLGIVGWPITYFLLSDEEQSKAGIYLGGEGRDDQTGL
jgi:uncharacterized protein YyaL (SSP411 family)